MKKFHFLSLVAVVALTVAPVISQGQTAAVPVPSTAAPALPAFLGQAASTAGASVELHLLRDGRLQHTMPLGPAAAAALQAALDAAGR